MCVVTNPCSRFMPDSLYIEDSCPHERKTKTKNKTCGGTDGGQRHTSRTHCRGTHSWICEEEEMVGLGVSQSSKNVR